MKGLPAIIGLLLLFLPGVVLAQMPAPAALAKRIDELIAKKQQANGVLAAAKADDAEFLRRAYLDLTGRIPKVSEVREFLADQDADKRAKLIASLLESPRHARHFANVWRALLTPEITANGQAGVFQAGFEAWLYSKFRTRAGYDTLVKELLAVPIASDPKAAEVVFSDFEKPNALAFYAVKDAKPENLASAAARIFLGVQLECAQCHDHPFASWSREQFWNQAAFFAGIQREGGSLFAPLIEKSGVHEVVLTTARKVPAVFLDGLRPEARAEVSPRTALAEWITGGDNPYFARATVNRLWGLLFGTGIVEPVDNFHDDNKPSHPALLDELSHAFVQSKFDLNYVLTAICLSEAYQRTSARTHPSQDSTRLFARMEPKALTGEQFFDSLALATGYLDAGSANIKGKRKGNAGVPARELFLTQFALRAGLNEPETSIQQALTLMNGRFVTDATSLGKNATLTAAVEMPLLRLPQRIEILYLATLSRAPTATETQRLTHYVKQVDETREAERLADIFWMLLNTAEFRLNH
jgi:hypothetical protein